MTLRGKLVTGALVLTFACSACRNYTSIKPSTLPTLAADGRIERRGELRAENFEGEPFSVDRDFRVEVESSTGRVSASMRQ